MKKQAAIDWNEKRLNGKPYRVEIGNFVKLDEFRPNEKSRWLDKNPIYIGRPEEMYPGEYMEVRENRNIAIKNDMCGCFTTNNKNDELEEINAQLGRLRLITSRLRNAQTYLRRERTSKFSEWVNENDMIGGEPKENFFFPIVDWNRVKMAMNL